MGLDVLEEGWCELGDEVVAVFGGVHDGELVLIESAVQGAEEVFGIGEGLGDFEIVGGAEVGGAAVNNTGVLAVGVGDGVNVVIIGTFEEAAFGVTAEVDDTIITLAGEIDKVGEVGGDLF